MTKEERNAYYKSWKRQLHEAGLCVDCKREDAYTMAGHWHCYECSRKAAARITNMRKQADYNTKRRLHDRALENERREKGLCFRCGKPLTDTRYKTCELCRAKIAEYKRLRYGKVNYPRGANDICWRCNKRPKMEGHKVCEVCYKSLVENMELAREACDRANHYWKTDEKVRRLKRESEMRGGGFTVWNGKPGM